MKCTYIQVISALFLFIFNFGGAFHSRELWHFKRVEPCLRLRPWTNFYLYLLPNHSIQLGNMSLEIGDPNVVVLIKGYYDFALTRIQGATFEDRNPCFHQLNVFISNFISNVILPLRNELTAKPSTMPQDISLWKLQTVVKSRLLDQFRDQYVPSRQYNGTVQGVQRACQIQKKIDRLQIDRDMELLIVHRDSNLMEGHSYAEKGCFSFFEKRIARGTGYFKDSDIDISAPYFQSTNLLAFPDGTQLRVSKEHLLSVLVTYYRCTMMEILAVRDPEARLCYVNLFKKNMQLLIVKLEQKYAVNGLDLLLATVKEPKSPELPETFGKCEHRHQNTNSNELNENPERLMIDSSSKYEKASLVTNHITESPMDLGQKSHVDLLDGNGDDKVTKISVFEPPVENSNTSLDGIWEEIKYHIIMGVCIILGLVFFLIVFLGFFIAWLAYASRITKMRREQDTINFLRRDQDEQNDDLDETSELLNRSLTNNK